MSAPGCSSMEQSSMELMYDPPTPACSSCPKLTQKSDGLIVYNPMIFIKNGGSRRT